MLLYTYNPTAFIKDPFFCFWHGNKAVELLPLSTKPCNPNQHRKRREKTGKVTIKTHPSINSRAPNCYCQQPLAMFFRAAAEQAPFTPTTHSRRKRGALDNGEHTTRRAALSK